MWTLRQRTVSASVLLLLILLSQAQETFPQSTPMPTSPSGTNTVAQNGSVYCFVFNGDTLYKYTTSTAFAGATFYGIQAKGYNGQWFRPSNVGGVVADFNGTTKYPWEDVQYSFLNNTPTKTSDTITIDCRMTYGESSYDYQYKLHISGRTLVIRTKALNGLNATQFTLDRCEQAISPNVVKIPFLTLFNLLSCNNSFTSMFFDWEITGCSRYDPIPTSAEVPTEGLDTYSRRFGPVVSYLKQTSGYRWPLKETIYLTVSPDLNGALPNLPGPVAPRKQQSANKIVVSYGPPFPWLLYPTDGGYPYKYLHQLKSMGVDSLAVIIKQYQRFGTDCKLPDILPANDYTTAFYYDPSGNSCGSFPAGGNGGNATLRAVRDTVVSGLGYDFALHQNYVDYYSDAPSYNSAKASRLPDNSFAHGWPFSCCAEGMPGTANFLKPWEAWGVASGWQDQLISAGCAQTWTYLDVQSAINPSNNVDYEAGTYGAKFVQALQSYRSLPDLFRQRYSGPVEGEGYNHFLFVGYFDDFEGRIHTTDYNLYGYKAPLLVDFDLLKMHDKSAQHGVGHIDTYFGNTWSANDTSDLTIQGYVAAELAYGHGGLITQMQPHPNHTIKQAILEQAHVYPMQRAYMNATPTEISYNCIYEGDYLRSASSYITVFPDYANISSQTFMSRVKVTYSNGTVVCVNRSPWAWTVNIGVPGGWFTRNINGVASPIAGFSASTSFTLKPLSGWACYNPLIQQDGMQKTISLQPFVFRLSQNYPNPFNPQTTIKYQIPEDGYTTLKVFDLLGKEVAVLTKADQRAGNHEVVFDASTFPSGVYFYRLQTGSNSQTNKMIIVR